MLILTMECQSPSSGIQSFFETICGINVSAGRISNILSEAAKRAKDFDDTVDLSGISQMAVNEIFQCGKPILTGVDPVSTYTFASPQTVQQIVKLNTKIPSIHAIFKNEFKQL